MARLAIFILSTPFFLYFSILPAAAVDGSGDGGGQSQADGMMTSQQAGVIYSNSTDNGQDYPNPSPVVANGQGANTSPPAQTGGGSKASTNIAPSTNNSASSSTTPAANMIANIMNTVNKEAATIDAGTAPAPSTLASASGANAALGAPTQIGVNKQAAMSYMNALNQKLLEAGTPEARAAILDQPENQFTCGLHGGSSCGTNRDLVNYFPQIVAGGALASGLQNSEISRSDSNDSPPAAGPNNVVASAPATEPNQAVAPENNSGANSYLGMKSEPGLTAQNGVADAGKDKGASSIVPQNFIDNLEKQLAQVEESKEALALIQQIGKAAGDKDLENLQSLEGLGDLQVQSASAAMPNSNANTQPGAAAQSTDSLQEDLAHAAAAPLSKHDELLQTLGSIVARQKYKNSPNRMPANGIGANLLAEDLFLRAHRAHTRFYENFYKNKS